MSTIVTIQIRADKRNKQSEMNAATTLSDDVEEMEDVSNEYEVIEETPIPTDNIQTIEKKTSVFSLPVDGEIIKEYSMDNLTYSITMGDWRQHSGTDIICEYDAEIRAMSDGVVTDVYNDHEFGSTVVLSHEGDVITKYSSISVYDGIFEGAEVNRGDVIGRIVNNPICEREDEIHLHLEASKADVRIDPMSLINQK